MRRTMILLAVSLFVGGAHAQLRETIDVRLIEVTVTVTDAKGQPVRGLKAEDFELYDDGKRQVITNFDVADYGGPTPPAARTPAARRNFLLIFDVTNAAPASLLRARETALDFVARQAMRLDRIAVATISSQQGLHLLTSFTTDRDLVTAAIRTLGVPRFYQIRDPLLIAFTTPIPADTSLTEVEAAVRTHLEEMTAMNQKVAFDAQRYGVDRQLVELSELGRALDHVTGRKHIIFFSEGFDPRALQGRAQLATQEARQEQAAVERGEIWRVDTDAIYGNTSSGIALRGMIESMRRSDVVLHTMDVKGLRTDVDTREGVKQISNDALYLLSHDTGGLLFKNSNQLTTDLGRFLKSQEVVYTLAFRMRTETPGRFRRLAVKVPSAEGAKVFSRIGYYEPQPASGALPSTLVASDIILNRMPLQEVGVTGFAAAVPQKNIPGLVPVVLDIAGPPLLKSAEGAGNASAEVFVYAFDGDERVRDMLHQRIVFDLGKIDPKTLGAGVRFYGTLRLQQGEYSVRALVRSAGQNGFVEIPVVVPASTEQYAVAPLFFADPDRGVKVRGPSRPGDEYPFHVGEKTFVPASYAALAPGVPREMALFLYNVPMDGLKLKGAVNAGGATRDVSLALLGRTEQDDIGLVKLLMNVTAPAGMRGDGSFLVTIGGSAGADLQEVSVPVRIE